MASLDILCFNPFNLKNEIMKIEHQKIFCGPSKILKNISWSINLCLIYFMTPTKTIRPAQKFIGSFFGNLFISKNVSLKESLRISHATLSTIRCPCGKILSLEY